MIKFFRKIRHRLLSQGKMRRYFTYAIGEIILVVIGILIALQINNWNETKKNSRKELYLLKQLQKEFKKDSSNLARQAWLTKLKVDDGKIIKSFLEGNSQLRVDSLVSFLFYNGKALLFQSHTPTYDEIISSGNLSLISNESLKTTISNYKSNISSTNSFLFMEAHSIKQKYNAHIYKYFDAEIMTYLWKRPINTPTNRLIEREALKNYTIDVNNFKKDMNSLYHIRAVIGVDSELNFQYTQRINKRINSILIKIQTELDKLND